MPLLPNSYVYEPERRFPIRIWCGVIFILSVKVTWRFPQVEELINQAPRLLLYNIIAEFGGACEAFTFRIMKKLLFLMFGLFLLLPQIEAKNINPVTSDGVKIIDLTQGKVKGQFDKKERDKIKVLIFTGYTGDTYQLDDKDMAEISAIPNLQSIEIGYYPNQVWAPKPNVSFNSSLPNVKILIIGNYDNEGNLEGKDDIYDFFNITRELQYNSRRRYEERNFKEVISGFRGKFPALETLMIREKIPNDLPDIINQDSYAVILDKNRLPNQWNAYVRPKSGLIILSKGPEPDFTVVPSIVPGYQGLQKNTHISVSPNILFIGVNAFDDNKLQAMRIEDSDSPLIIGRYKGYGNQEINRPLIIQGNFNTGRNASDRVTFNKPVILEGQANLYANEATFKDNVSLPLHTLENTARVNFEKTPVVTSKDKITWDKKIIKIPDGMLNEFVALGFPKSNIASISTAPIILKLEKPNTILSYLSPNKLDEVEDLTIIGFLYDTDIKILNECKNLKKLDLSKAVITTSPETQQARRDDAEFASFLFGAMNSEAQRRYQNGTTSATTAWAANALSELADLDLKNVNKGIDECGLPRNSFYGLQFLEEVKLPLTATYIGGYSFANCPSLKIVEFPPYLKTIGLGAFDNCGLESVKLPASVESIGDYHNKRCAFGNCPNLRLLDLGDCSFRPNNRGEVAWECPLYDKLVLVLPKNIQYIKTLQLSRGSVIYCPPTLQAFQMDNRFYDFTLYMQTQTPAKGYLSDCKIYVPNGALTAWYAKYGKDGNDIIEGTKSRP